MDIRVNHSLGLHLRVAAEFVQMVSLRRSRIRVRLGSKDANGKSLLDLISLAASCGTKLTVIADGEDAEQVLRDVQHFFEKTV
jgi:phosphocarrier protein